MSVYIQFCLVITRKFPLSTCFGDEHAVLPPCAVGTSKGRSGASRGKSAVHFIAVVGPLLESCVQESLIWDPD